MPVSNEVMCSNEVIPVSNEVIHMVMKSYMSAIRSYIR